MSRLNMVSARADLQSREPARRAAGVRTVQTLQEAGDPLAAYAVGTWMLHGEHGYAKSEDGAAPYLQYAADHGLRDALFDLGVLVERRKLGRQPRRAAFNDYLAAAVLGDKDAAQEVVRCLYHGIGTFADRKAAERLFDALNQQQQAPADS